MPDRIKRIIDLLVITVGQYQIFQEERYERQFEMYLRMLQRETGKNQEEAIQFLIDTVEGRERVA